MVSKIKSVFAFMLIACTLLSLAGCTSVPEKESAPVKKTVGTRNIFVAAKMDDIDAFAALVQGGADLNVTNDEGMTVQLALAYFSDANFKKACAVLDAAGFDFDKENPQDMTLLYTLAYGLQTEKIKTLLSYNVDVNKKSNGLLPIQATQFSTYIFNTKQTVNLKNYGRAEQIQNLLLANGSEPFSYFEPTFGYVGNFLFCLGSSLSAIDSTATPDRLNNIIDWKWTCTDDRSMFSVNYESLTDLFSQFGAEVEVTYSADKAQIPALIQKAVEDPDYPFFIYGFTGDSIIAPYQWVAFREVLNMKPAYQSADYCDVFNPNSYFDHATYQLSDFSEIILIKVVQY